MKGINSFCLGCLLIGVCTTVSANENIGTMGRVISPATNDIFSSGIYAARDTFGMRANAVVLAARANAQDSNSYPVNGFNFTKALANYGGRDSVGLYADNTSDKFKNWEVISKTSFTPTSVTSSDIDSRKIKPGMILDTNSVPKWSAYVVSVKDHKITTYGWVNNKTKRMGTPTSGSDILINPTTKIWATNFNVFLKQGGKANAAVIQENGLVNNANSNPNAINGLDTVVLPSSQFGGTAAYLARSAKSGHQQQWLMGFVSQGAKNANFLSADVSANVSSNAGFVENSSAAVGFVFSGKNKDSSLEWRSNNKVVTKYTPDGKLMKVAFRTKVIHSSEVLHDDYYKYIINSSNVTKLTLPSKRIISEGFTIEIDNFSQNKIVFDADANINAKFDGERKLIATFVDGEWFVI